MPWSGVLGMLTICVYSSAPVHGERTEPAATHAKALVPEVLAPRGVKTIWSFWMQGMPDLKTTTSHKYRNCSACVDTWKSLNPGWDLRLLDDHSAAALSPSYRAYRRGRGIEPALLSDILRLDLLNRYG